MFDRDIDEIKNNENINDIVVTSTEFTDTITNTFFTPSPIRVSTRSASCRIGLICDTYHNVTELDTLNDNRQITYDEDSAYICELNCKLNINKLVYYFVKQIIYEHRDMKNDDYLIQSIKINNILVSYTEKTYARYGEPLIMYFDNIIHDNNIELCNRLITDLENSIYKLSKKQIKKRVDQTKKKDKETFYNCCSFKIIPKRNVNPVDIKLFNNGKITLSGSREYDYGLIATNFLLNELKKIPDIFVDMSLDIINQLSIINYDIYYVNSDYKLNFKINLNILLNILYEIEHLSPKAPDKYKGLILHYYWNINNIYKDGICRCNNIDFRTSEACAVQINRNNGFNDMSRINNVFNNVCSGKSNGLECKKITISIFKTGSVCIMGAKNDIQINDVYNYINDLMYKYYDKILVRDIKEILLLLSDDEEENDI